MEVCEYAWILEQHVVSHWIPFPELSFLGLVLACGSDPHMGCVSNSIPFDVN
jgi:hypothetical protein